MGCSGDTFNKKYISFNQPWVTEKSKSNFCQIRIHTKIKEKICAVFKILSCWASFLSDFSNGNG